MNIAKRWLRAALQRMYKEHGVEPAEYDKDDGVYRPVAMNRVVEWLWSYLREERDRTEDTDSNEGQFEE